MSFDDKELICKDCGQPFVFTAGEQEFYAEKGFENVPGRCASCRSARKNQSRGGYNSGRTQQREMFSAVCASCGVETQVPFKPNGLKPVYCRDCFQR